MGNRADGRRFSRLVFTYAWVIGIGIVIVVVHAFSKSKASSSSVDGVVQQRLSSQSDSTAGMTATSSAPGTFTSTTPMHSGDGRPVYTTDFGQSDLVFLGWPTGPYSFVNIEQHPNGYAVSGSGRHVTLIPAPVPTPFEQIAISARAKMSANAPPDAGFGIYCRTQSLFYEFEDAGKGTWSIIRGNSAATLDPRYVPVVLAHGHVTAKAADRGGTVSGVCAVLPNNSGVRLGMFVDGVEVADLVDTKALSDSGWRVGIASNDSEVAVSTVTFTSFSQTTFDVDRGQLVPLPEPTTAFVAQT